MRLQIEKSSNVWSEASIRITSGDRAKDVLNLYVGNARDATILYNHIHSTLDGEWPICERGCHYACLKTIPDLLSTYPFFSSVSFVWSGWRSFENDNPQLFPVTQMRCGDQLLCKGGICRVETPCKIHPIPNILERAVVPLTNCNRLSAGSHRFSVNWFPPRLRLMRAQLIPSGDELWLGLENGRRFLLAKCDSSAACNYDTLSPSEGIKAVVGLLPTCPAGCHVCLPNHLNLMGMTNLYGWIGIEGVDDQICEESGLAFLGQDYVDVKVERLMKDVHQFLSCCCSLGDTSATFKSCSCSISTTGKLEWYDPS